MARRFHPINDDTALPIGIGNAASVSGLVGRVPSLEGPRSQTRGPTFPASRSVFQARGLASDLSADKLAAHRAPPASNKALATFSMVTCFLTLSHAWSFQVLLSGHPMSPPLVRLNRISGCLFLRL